MSKKKITVQSIIIGLISGFINGLFGSGGGTIVVPSLVFVVGMAQYKAHATALTVILPLSIISAIVYFNNQFIDFSLAFKVSIGSIIGSYIGARALNKIPNKWLRKIFGLFMIIAGIRMVI